VNQYDVTASLLQDFFTPIPDYRPYTLVYPDKRIFDPQKAMNRYNRSIDWRKIMQGPKLDDEDEQREDHYKQQSNDK
jgi:hypothetical protein